MKIQVIATVVYPVYINQEIEMPEGYSPEDLKEKVLNYADLYLQQGSSSPIIQDSKTNSEIVD